MNFEWIGDSIYYYNNCVGYVGYVEFSEIEKKYYYNNIIGGNLVYCDSFEECKEFLEDDIRLTLGLFDYEVVGIEEGVVMYEF